MLFKCSLRIVGHPHVPSCVESGFPLIFLFTWSSWRLLRPLGKTNPAIHLYPKWGRNLFGFSGSVQTPGIVWTSFCLLFQRGRLIAFIRFSKGSATASRSTPLPPHQDHRCSLMAFQAAGSRWKKLSEVSGAFMVHSSHGSTVRSWQSFPLHTHLLMSSHSCFLLTVDSALTRRASNWGSRQPRESQDWYLNYSAVFWLHVKQKGIFIASHKRDSLEKVEALRTIQLMSLGLSQKGSY